MSGASCGVRSAALAGARYGAVMRRVAACGVAVCVLWGASLIGGCAAPPTTDAERVPPDFVLGVTVYPSEARRRARYVVEADAQLRAAEGEGVDPGVFPLPTRRLDRHERQELWTLVHGTGVLSPDSPWTIGSVERVDAPPEGGVVAIFVTAGGRSRHAAAPIDEPAVAALTDWLRSVAYYER